MTQPAPWSRWNPPVVLQLGLLLAFTTLAILFWTKAVWPQRFLWPQASGEAIFCIRTQDPVMALTFDDGPHPIYTPAILDVLEAYQAKSTFFAIGRHLEQYPHIAQSLVDQGHELANHTFSHPDLNRRLRSEIEREVQQTDTLLAPLVKSSQPYFRPPYGHANLVVMQALKDMGRPILFWDVDLLDWSGLSVAQMMTMLAKQAHPGAIVLMHDASPSPDGSPQASRQKTVELVKQILATYTPQGYRFVTLSELLTLGTPQASPSFCR